MAGQAITVNVLNGFVMNVIGWGWMEKPAGSKCVLCLCKRSVLIVPIKVLQLDKVVIGYAYMIAQPTNQARALAYQWLPAAHTHLHQLQPLPELTVLHRQDSRSPAAHVLHII